jgi:hypothetical protein
MCLTWKKPFPLVPRVQKCPTFPYVHTDGWLKRICKTVHDQSRWSYHIIELPTKRLQRPNHRILITKLRRICHVYVETCLSVSWLYDEIQEWLPRNSNIQEFWSLSSFTQLSQMANILFTTPATRKSVKFIFTPFCARIWGNLLSDMVFLKANQVNFLIFHLFWFLLV